MLESRCSVRVSLMIWGCITYEGVGTLTVVDGDINAQKYIEVIDNFVWPVIAHHFPDDNYVFQDDNAPIQRTCVVKEYMEETDLHGIEWPVLSPDLNIIENVWHKIKHELQKHVQNITSRQLLETVIRNIWTEIPDHQTYTNTTTWIQAWWSPFFAWSSPSKFMVQISTTVYLLLYDLERSNDFYKGALD